MTQRPETSAVVYFGHFCAECHASGPTRRLDGRYICDACRQAIAEGPAPEPEIVENTQRRFGSRHKSRRLAS